MASCDSDCPSVPELASVDEVSVCLQVFTNMIAFKSLAKCFMYPGLPVSATNSSAAAYYCFHYLSASAVISVNYTKFHQILDDAVCMKYVSWELVASWTTCQCHWPFWYCMLLLQVQSKVLHIYTIHCYHKYFCYSTIRHQYQIYITATSKIMIKMFSLRSQWNIGAFIPLHCTRPYCCKNT